MRGLLFPALVSAALLLCACNPGEHGSAQAPSLTLPTDYPIAEKSIAALQADLSTGVITSAQLVEHFQFRIATLDKSGPQINSVLTLNPDAMRIAQELDRERAKQGPRGPLHGIPILLKDNIESADKMPTTAGSLALQDNLTGRDAPLVQRLRAAGAIILGKTNLSEWANIRSARSISGWSALGGLTRNPHALDRSTCGSSSGSAAAVAASFAVASIGTETDGSITCPAAVTGIVGFKPTLGLVSRTHLIPIAASQDTAGPMARSVADVALLLQSMAGTDLADPSTLEADRRKTDYLAALQPDALHGKRIGVLRFATGYHAALDGVFENSLAQLREAGVTLVEIDAFPALETLQRNEPLILLTEFKIGLARYLADAPVKLPISNLEQLITFNNQNAEQELLFFGQELLEQAADTAPDSAYQRMREQNRKVAGPDGIDRLLREHQLDALVAPTTAPAWSIDLLNGDHFLGSVSTLPAVAGYPHLTVPMGDVFGLPVGLSIIGSAWQDATVLALGYAFEQRAGIALVPNYVVTDMLPAIAGPDEDVFVDPSVEKVKWR